MKVYQARDDEGGGEFFGTKGEAVKEARSMAKYTNYPTEVVEYEILPGKRGIVALANGRGWCAETKVIQIIKGKKPE